MGTTCASPVAKCALGTHPALGPSPVGGPSMLPKGEHIGPYLFAAKELIPCMLLQGLMSIRALIRHPKELHTNPSQSLQFDCSTGDPSQHESIHYYILLHILKIISIFGLYASVHAEMVVQHCLYISTMLRRCGLYQQMVIKC